MSRADATLEPNDDSVNYVTRLCIILNRSQRVAIRFGWHMSPACESSKSLGVPAGSLHPPLPGKDRHCGFSPASKRFQSLCGVVSCSSDSRPVNSREHRHKSSNHVTCSASCSAGRATARFLSTFRKLASVQFKLPHDCSTSVKRTFACSRAFEYKRTEMP